MSSIRCLRCDHLIVPWFLPCEPCAAQGIPVNGYVDYAHETCFTDGNGLRMPAETPGRAATPLDAAGRLGERLGLQSLYLKDETGPPTWSYKDRLAEMAIAHAASVGMATVIASSSGNHGAAVAAAATSAGMRSIILTTRSIGPAMRRAIEGAGGTLVPLATAQDRWILMREAVRTFGWYPASNFSDPPVGSNPYAIEGYKPLAAEIVAQLGRYPDWVVVPVGYGDGLAGVARGFRELSENGRPPRMLAAVTSEAIPEALRKGSDVVNPHPVMAPSALSITGGFGTFQALHAIRTSEGAAVVVDEVGIVEAQIQASRLAGRMLELSSAAALAALNRAVIAGLIARDAVVVAVLTSTGLKETPVAELPALVPIAPTTDELMRRIESAAPVA